MAWHVEIWLYREAQAEMNSNEVDSDESLTQTLEQLRRDLVKTPIGCLNVYFLVFYQINICLPIYNWKRSTALIFFPSRFYQGVWDFHLWSGSVEALTASDGPFPLAEEDVEHFGTVQQLGMKDLVLCQDVTRAGVLFSPHVRLYVFFKNRPWSIDLSIIWFLWCIPGPFFSSQYPVCLSLRRYRCWQKGPNSLVSHTLPEFFNDSFTRTADKEFLVTWQPTCVK